MSSLVLTVLISNTKSKGVIFMSFNKVQSWIITLCFVVIAFSSVYIAIRMDEIIERLATIAEFISISGGS